MANRFTALLEIKLVHMRQGPLPVYRYPWTMDDIIVSEWMNIASTLPRSSSTHAKLSHVVPIEHSPTVSANTVASIQTAYAEYANRARAFLVEHDFFRVDDTCSLTPEIIMSGHSYKSYLVLLLDRMTVLAKSIVDYRIGSATYSNILSNCVRNAHYFETFYPVEGRRDVQANQVLLERLVDHLRKLIGGIKNTRSILKLVMHAYAVPAPLAPFIGSLERSYAQYVADAYRYNALLSPSMMDKAKYVLCITDKSGNRVLPNAFCFQFICFWLYETRQYMPLMDVLRPKDVWFIDYMQFLFPIADRTQHYNAPIRIHRATHRLPSPRTHEGR